MTSPRPTRVLTALGWFLAPIVVVRGAVLLLDHPGPVTALGSDNAAPGVIETPQVPVRPVWTESSRAAAKHAERAIAKVLGTSGLASDFPPLMAAEDFAFMLEERPGAYILLGQGTGPDSRMVHHPEYDFDDAIIPLGASLLAALTER